MRITAYRVSTVLIIGECATGGVLDLFRQPPFYPVMIDLGYPPYFATILGTAKLLAAAALLTPGFPRLKEWAYAGILINMIGAGASHLATGDPLTAVIAPATFAVTALTSWRLRHSPAGTSRSRRAGGRLSGVHVGGHGIEDAG